MEKVDFKKKYQKLYMPPRNPVLIDVPEMQFLMIDGKGAPESAGYQEAVSILYAVAFTLKMNKKIRAEAKDFFDYTVPPLEGLWYCPADLFSQREQWTWTSMIRQPDFVNQTMFEIAVSECRAQKPELDFSKVRLETFKEGLCVQMMHIGSYKEEAETVLKIEGFIAKNSLINKTSEIYRHHEIYLSDPRKAKPENMKTILRLPAEKK